MISVGLVKELFFISKYFKQKVCSIICIFGGSPKVELSVSPEGLLDVAYKNQLIWRENVDGPTSMFGVESCDTIARIMTCIDNGTDWKQHAWKENLDGFPNP